MKYNFRAWYIPDMEDELLKFTLHDVYGQMEFASPNEDVFYSMGIVFADKDWLVEQSTGIYDSYCIEVYVGDIVEYTGDDGVKRNFEVDGSITVLDKLNKLRNFEVITTIHQMRNDFKKYFIGGNIDE